MPEGRVRKLPQLAVAGRSKTTIPRSLVNVRAGARAVKQHTTSTCGTLPCVQYSESVIAVSVLGVGARARAVRHEGNFVGKKRLECKIHHVGGQNGKTQLGPKVTFTRRPIISATRDTCRPSGRYRGRRVNIATEF